MTHDTRSRRRRPLLLVVLAVLLLAAACGSDRDEPSADDDSTDSTAASAATSFGDLESPCGEGDGGEASDVGVTADAIAIGYGDDAGYAAAPGINKEMGEAMEAIIDWCNDQGGINGRPVKGTYYDAKITEVNNAVTQACSDKVFMLVGNGYSLDAAQEQTRLGCDLPSFPTFAVSPEFANGPKMISAVPNPVDYQPVSEARFYAATYPAKAKKMATMFGNFSATIDTKDKSLSTWAKVGVTFLECDQEYNIVGEADWKPFAQKLKDCGAEAVEYVGAPFPNFVNLLEAADQLDYHPDWLLQANFYNVAFAKWNTKGLADNIYVRTADVPFEAASTSKATQQYLDLMEKSGGEPALLGAHGVSAFLLWAQSVKACGADVTRECVLAEAAKVHEWTGGGLHGPTDPGKNMPTSCEAVLGLKGTTWIQRTPKKAGELECNDDNVQQATGPVVDKVDLGPDRVVRKYEK